MGGTADGQKFSQPLDDSQDEGLKRKVVDNISELYWSRTRISLAGPRKKSANRWFRKKLQMQGAQKTEE